MVWPDKLPYHSDTIEITMLSFNFYVNKCKSQNVVFTQDRSKTISTVKYESCYSCCQNNTISRRTVHDSLDVGKYLTAQVSTFEHLDDIIPAAWTAVNLRAMTWNLYIWIHLVFLFVQHFLTFALFNVAFKKHCSFYHSRMMNPFVVFYRCKMVFCMTGGNHFNFWNSFQPFSHYQLQKTEGWPPKLN